MLVARVTLLIFLLVTLSGCNDVARQRRSKALLNDANKLIARDTEVTQQWTNEVGKTFTPENRAKFPANRDFLRAHAAQIIKLLDESSSLNKSAADKYEQAAELSNNDQQHRGMRSFASGFRRTVEVNGMLKSLMQTVFDESVMDEKALNAKFSDSRDVIQQKRHEVDQEFQAGKRLLGW
jgi:hypothetical protein